MDAEKTQGEKDKQLALTAGVVVFVLLPLAGLALIDVGDWRYWVWLAGGLMLLYLASLAWERLVKSDESDQG